MTIVLNIPNCSSNPTCIEIYIMVTNDNAENCLLIKYKRITETCTRPLHSDCSANPWLKRI